MRSFDVRLGDAKVGDVMAMAMKTGQRNIRAMWRDDPMRESYRAEPGSSTGGGTSARVHDSSHRGIGTPFHEKTHLHGLASLPVLHNA